MQPNGSGDFLPCQAVITEWKDFYKKVTLSNKGKILLEDSKATCPIGGSNCIEITKHGQKAGASSQNLKNADKKVLAEILPGIDFDDLKEDQAQHIS